jgi:membrane protease subunit (stomatin/prohibitin family)
LNDYVKFQIAQGMGAGTSPAEMAAEMAIGMSLAQQMMQQTGGILGNAKTLKSAAGSASGNWRCDRGNTENVDLRGHG